MIVVDNSYNWIIKDISNSLILNLFYNDGNKLKLIDSYDVFKLLDVVSEPANVGFANINDITNLLTIYKVRFIDIKDSKNIIDIPIRNIYKLYEKATKIDEIFDGKKVIPVSELDAFVIYDGASVKDRYFIEAIQIREISNHFSEFLDKTREFGNMDMQEKFDALSSVNEINYKRVRKDNI